MAGHQPPEPQPLREFRVFVSSTFRDMKVERDELVLRIFPRLRKACQERGVVWSDVDLRWGITEEQAAEGKVLPICLAEIKRRPYFVGILGERYGWIPDEIPDDLTAREPWLKEHRERSVTELEMLHGVLEDPHMADRAFFYFRDPAYIDSLPEADRAEHLELPRLDIIEKHGRERAERLAQESRDKLKQLKNLIAERGFSPRPFANPKELGRLVEEDLFAAIEEQFPFGEAPGPDEREEIAHSVFERLHTPVRTKSGDLSGVYLERPAYTRRLDRYAQGAGPPLVVSGQPGSGRTALVASWAVRCRSGAHAAPLIAHYIGASSRSTDWMRMLRRLIERLAEISGHSVGVPDEPDALKMAFARALGMAAHASRVVLVIDGLEQLEDRGGARALAWLPEDIPPNIRLILTTAPGVSLDELDRRMWPIARITPLRQRERRKIARRYLHLFGKSLGRRRLARVTRAKQTGNPLFLRALLEELRVFGVHEELDARVDHYLEANTLEELCARILDRYADAYGRDREELVADSMRLLWAGRRGLTEPELLELMGQDGEPLQSAHWSPLSLAADWTLVNRSGVIGFAHDAFREAVRAKFVKDRDVEQSTRHTLAAYFGSRETDDRTADELPWQLAKADSWHRLHEVLRGAEFFDAVWNADEFDMKRYWALVEGEAALRMPDAYERLIESPETIADPEARLHLALFMNDTGHPGEAGLLWSHLAAYHEKAGDRAAHARALGNLAGIMATRGEPDRALELHAREEQTCREIADSEGLQRSLGNQGLILRRLKRYEDSLAKHEEQEAIAKTRDDLDGLSACLLNMGVTLYFLKRLDDAIAVLGRGEKISRSMGDPCGTMRILAQNAMIAMDRNQLDEAMKLSLELERLARSVGDRRILHGALGNRGMVFYDRRRYGKALELLREQEAICRDIGENRGLAECLRNQATVLIERKEPDAALEALEEAETLARPLGDHELVVRSLLTRASLLGGYLDRPRDALPLTQEAKRMAIEHGLSELVEDAEKVLRELAIQLDMRDDEVDPPGTFH
jgi:tetratricopeptide (TPR) repeat protein